MRPTTPSPTSPARSASRSRAASATSYAGSDAVPPPSSGSSARAPALVAGVARRRGPPTADEMLDALIAEHQRAGGRRRAARGPAGEAAAASRGRSARLVEAAASGADGRLALQGAEVVAPALAQLRQQHPELPIRVSGDMAEAVRRVAGGRRARSAGGARLLALPPPPADESGGAPVAVRDLALPEPVPKARRLTTKSPAHLRTASLAERRAHRAAASSSAARARPAPYRTAHGTQGTRGP